MNAAKKLYGACLDAQVYMIQNRKETSEEVAVIEHLSEAIMDAEQEGLHKANSPPGLLVAAEKFHEWFREFDREVYSDIDCPELKNFLAAIAKAKADPQPTHGSLGGIIGVGLEDE